MPSGDAFRISDLHRLENETLPTFFRHKRFQSLVRQLNFYNFRKVNRERTFWVYRHALFHRDRPSELHLLRRRTCPGVDGRKHRPELDISSLETGLRSPKTGSLTSEVDQQDDLSDESIAITSDQSITKKRKIKADRSLQKKLRRQRKITESRNSSKHDPDLRINDGSPSAVFHPTSNETQQSNHCNEVEENKSNHLRSQMFLTPELKSYAEPKSITTSNVMVKEDFMNQTNNKTSIAVPIDSKLKVQGPVSPPPEIMPLEINDLKEESPHTLLPSLGTLADDTDEKNRSERMEQSLLVSKVARQLEEHAKRAAAAAALGHSRRGGRRRAGTITPPHHFPTDTMKYNALTYDDEVEFFDSKQQKNTNKKVKNGSDGHAIVTDGDESDEDFKVNISVASSDKLETKSASIVHNNANLGKVETVATHKAPVSDTAVVSEVVRKLHNWVGRSGFASKEDGQLAAAIAGFCMSTAPQDPYFGNKARHLLLACGILAQEFRCYKAALSPNSAPPDFFTNEQTKPALITQIFDGDSSANDAVRVFKVFVLNSLGDLVTNPNLASSVSLSRSEATCLNECMKVWFEGVMASI